MGQIHSLLKQSFNIPAPTFTERELPDQAGKVHIVTGGYAGCGLELVRLLYQKNATVYVAGRSEEKASKSIKAVKEQFPSSTGRLEFLRIDFSDLNTIKPAVQSFLEKEKRLDVLTNNAGVMIPPAGSQDAHGHELQIGTNCLGPFLFTELLVPVLRSTAASSSTPGSTRVTWAASLAVPIGSPRSGVQFDANGAPKVFGDRQTDYAQSKAGNFLLAAEFARRYGKKDSIVSVAWNPGNLKSELQRHAPKLMNMALSFMLHPVKFGGYTELFAGWSPKVGLDTNGGYVIPWGRVDTPNLRKDVLLASKTKEEGGTGVGEKFWEWCDKETKEYR